MPAFSYVVSSQIRENIRSLYKRVAAVCYAPLTHEEFEQLFIPAHHREMYREMALVANVGMNSLVRIKWGELSLAFYASSYGEAQAPPAPRVPVIQHDAPPELVERITEWTLSGGDVHGDFGRVMALFDKLNDTLSKNQLRFVWPSILTIMNVSPNLSEAAKALQEVKIPAKQPTLPPGLLSVCRKTAAVVAMAGIMPADTRAEIGLYGYITAVPRQKYEEQGLGVFYGLDY